MRKPEEYCVFKVHEESLGPGGHTPDCGQCKGIEHAQVDSWNEAIEGAITAISLRASSGVVSILKKLKKEVSHGG